MIQGASGGGAPLIATLLRFEAAHKRRRFDEMRSCLCDDALLESIASDTEALGPDETIAAIQAAFHEGTYEIGDWRYEEMSPDVVLAFTGARHRLPSGGMRDETVCRLMSGRDGLVWRAKLFSDKAGALAHLAEHGPDLDLVAHEMGRELD